MGAFAERVFEVVQQIPRGKVASYGQVGKLIGAPRSARYVGYALRANPTPGVDPSSIPCHRVVFKDGSMASGFAFGGPDVQREMLEREGVSFTADGRIDMQACQWDVMIPEALQAMRGDDHIPSAPPEDFDWERELGEE